VARRGFKNIDWGLLIAILALTAVGLALVYTASRVPAYPWKSALFGRQMMWLAMGGVTLILAMAIPFRFWEEYSQFFYIGGLVLLVAVLVVGAEREGARRWLVVGGLQFQPAEIAKLATIVFLARMLARPRIDLRRLGTVAPVVGVGLLPFALILVEPDLGTSLSLPVAMIPMLFWAGFPLSALFLLVSPLLSVLLSWNLWVWLGFVAVVAALLFAIRAKRAVVVAVVALNMAAGAGAPILWNSLKPYQQERVLTFLNPEKDPADAGYQVIQSKIALGSGGWAGKGYLQGTQKGLAFLPEQHTDFIFAVLGEEFGFLGCVGVLLLFVLLIQRGLAVAVKARSRFAGLMAVGICGMILFHVAVNVSMTLGLAPVTGLPLPFLSYGGTFLLVTLAQCGLLLNVSLRRNEF
jgi:rod shape determining protein RodA